MSQTNAISIGIVCGETGQASELRKAKELQEFIQAVETKLTNPSQKVKDWLKWAKEIQVQTMVYVKFVRSTVFHYLKWGICKKYNMVKRLR